MPALRERALRAITPGEIMRAVQGAKFPTAKTHNNAISPLKLVFQYSVGERYLAESPAARIGWIKHQKAEPDPFTLGEARAILEWLGQNGEAQHANYFRFAFFTGLRTSELLALKWPKIDFRRGLARVDEAQVLKQDKPTKTYESRNVELNSESLLALDNQRQHTFLAHQHVFLDPLTGKPYVSDKPPRIALQRALKKLGIRHRAAYQTRHTFATLNLMAGAHPMWVARQMGHRTMQITLTTYSKWIEGADQGRERAKLESVLGQSLGQSETK